MGVFNLLALLVSFLWAHQTACGNAELRALMEIKSALDPSTNILTSWTADGDLCGFPGVACNEHGKVANISLQSKGLSGWISPAVADLNSLSGLYLHYNSLTGVIPKQIGGLAHLSDLYLDFNHLSGSIPSEIGNMESLQVLDLCCNQFNGSIPAELGSLKKLNMLSLKNNRLTGRVPLQLADIPLLEHLYLQNNTLTGPIPPALKRLNEELQYDNNPGLCGAGFNTLRDCDSATDETNTFKPGFSSLTNRTVAGRKSLPQPVNLTMHCYQTGCSGSSKVKLVAVIAGVVSLSFALPSIAFLTCFLYRRCKQKIGSAIDNFDDRVSSDLATDFRSKSASPLVILEYANDWDPMADDRNWNDLSQDVLNQHRFNLEEVECATQYFNEANLLGRSKFSSVYKGMLRDGSFVAIRSINITSCKSEEADFVRGLHLLTSLKHENLVRLRGFCCSKARGECFLVYDYAAKGSLSQYLDVQSGSYESLDWPTRIRVINGIAKGIDYLHSIELYSNKPPIVHQNISTNKVVIDQRFNPLITDSGLPRLLADDIVFSNLKVSAAMGYLAPEYITTGRFTEKSDIYAFGVIILQILSGKHALSSTMRLAAEKCKFGDFMDPNLEGKFCQDEAVMLAELALACTHELPEKRPTIDEVIQQLNKSGTTS
uniref:Protein kinase domain-containing protein n=1 Tax=Kalanchoe fedtschenkoi TaxID=63787 RepID=A0A7N0V9E7_KALFE